MKTDRTILIFAAVVVAFVAHPAVGDEITFTCDQGFWSNELCWDLERTPTSGDDVVIPYPYVCRVDYSAAECRSFKVGTTNDYGPKLIIETGNTLTFTQDSAILGQLIRGQVVLEGSGSTLKTLSNAGGTVTISGEGEIKGGHNAAKIVIDRTTTGQLTITSALTIRGALTIQGVSKFRNEGQVIADAGTVTLAVQSALSDTAGDRWFVRGAGSLLLFDEALPALISLAGNFRIDDGATSTSEMEFNRTLSTTGRLKMETGVVDVNENVTMGDDAAGNFMDMTGGKIDVAAGKKFEHK